MQSGASSTTGYVQLSSGGTSGRRFQSLTIEQTILNEVAISSELVDQSFIVEMNNLFLYVQNNAPDNIDSQRKATYLLTRTNSNSLGGAVLSFTVNSQSITDTQYTIYGLPNNKNLINTYVKITGIQSGAVLEFIVQISKT